MTPPPRPQRVLTWPMRKPMAMARRVSLFEREILVRLSPAAIEVLFEAASVLSEGQPDGDRYYGSTMLTIDLARTAGLVSDECDLATARRVAELATGDERVRSRARALAAGQATRFAGAPLTDPQIDFRVRRNGHHLHLDLDVEAALPNAAAPIRTLRAARRTP